MLMSEDCSVEMTDATGTWVALTGDTHRVQLQGRQRVQTFATLGDPYLQAAAGARGLVLLLHLVGAEGVASGQALFRAWYTAAVPGTRSFRLHVPSAPASGRMMYECTALLELVELVESQAGETDPPILATRMQVVGAVTVTQA